MAQYVITEDNTILAYEAAPDGTAAFRSYTELEHLTRECKGTELVTFYNNLASAQGVDAVRKFTNHETGVKRLWKLIEQLPITPRAPLPEPPADDSAVVVLRGATKKETVLSLVQRPPGATLEELMDATGWQAHSVRGFLSVQKRDYTIERIARPENMYAYYATRKG